MSTTLQKLGENWHIPHPYVSLIDTIVPSSNYTLDIENALLKVYEEEHYDFKSLKKDTPIHTLYDDELLYGKARRKELEEEMKAEGERYESLMKKFQELETPLSESEEGEEEEEEEEVEDDIKTTQKKKKGQQACKRSQKAEEQRKIQQAKGIKSSMASSQQKLIDLGNEVDILEKKSEYYKHYQYASRCYINGVRKATREYSETKDLPVLIKNLEDVISYYEMMMRRYVPSESCAGKGKGKGKGGGLCETHLLPLELHRNPVTGFRDVVKCCVSPK
jgi:hypothetical protein